MPTFNQLVKKGRQDKAYKSKSPVLQKGINTLKNKQTDLSAPQKRGVCTKVTVVTLVQTPLFCGALRSVCLFLRVLIPF